MNHIFTDEIKAKLSNPRVLKALDDWFEFGGTLKYPVIVTFYDERGSRWDIFTGSETEDDWVLWGINDVYEFNSIRLSDLSGYKMKVNCDSTKTCYLSV